MAPLAFITGASSGIGQALAQACLDAGYTLALSGRRTESMQAWADARSIAPDRLRIYAADVQDVDALVAAGHACLQTQGVPDLVIANAGISIGMDTRERGDLDVMARVLQTNTLGVAATFHPFIAAMQERGSGTLAGIASVAGVRGLPGHGAYCASKAAVISYCESLRGELKPSGVRVATICPGFIDTPLTRGNPYPMPFLMQPDAFARKALRALESGRTFHIIPWQMAWVARLLPLLPNAVFDHFLSGRPRKPRAATPAQ